jgi:hypothetical protein
VETPPFDLAFISSATDSEVTILMSLDVCTTSL